MNRLFGVFILIIVFCFAGTSFSVGAPELELTITDSADDDSPLSLTLSITNPSHELEKAQVFVAVNTGDDTLWFYPRWTAWPPQIGWETMDIAARSTTHLDILPNIPGLEHIDEFCCFNIYAALRHHGEQKGNHVSDRFGLINTNGRIQIERNTVNPVRKRPLKGGIIVIVIVLYLALISVYTSRSMIHNNHTERH